MGFLMLKLAPTRMHHLLKLAVGAQPSGADERSIVAPFAVPADLGKTGITKISLFF